MAELPVNNPPLANEFEDDNDDDLFASAIGVSYCFTSGRLTIVSYRFVGLQIKTILLYLPSFGVDSTRFQVVQAF